MDAKTFLGVGIGILVVALLQHFLFSAPSIDSQIVKIANEINKNCPFMVDSQTRLDNTVAGTGKTIIYNYTLINYMKDDVDTDTFESNVKPRIINMIKTSPDMKYLRDNDVVFEYNYSDKTGIHIDQLKIYPSDYKQ